MGTLINPQYRVPLLIVCYLVLDIPRPVGVLECIESLHEVSVSRTHTSYHEGLAVTPQGVLEEAGQLRVPVRNMRTFLGLVPQSTDDITKSQLQERERDNGRHTHQRGYSLDHS